MGFLSEVAYLARKGDVEAINNLVSEEILASTTDRALALIDGRIKADRESGREPRIPPLDYDQLAHLRDFGMGWAYNGKEYPK